MNFAKIVEGKIVFYSQPLRIDGRDIYTTDPRPYGYKEFLVDQYPEAPDGYYVTFDRYVETETQIIKKWRLERSEVNGDIY